MRSGFPVALDTMVEPLLQHHPGAHGPRAGPAGAAEGEGVDASEHGGLPDGRFLQSPVVLHAQRGRSHRGSTPARPLRNTVPLSLPLSLDTAMTSTLLSYPSVS